jgi:lysophospholipase L1-like esterase
VRLRLVVLVLVRVVGTSVGCSQRSASVTVPATSTVDGSTVPGRPLTVVGDSLSVLGRKPIRAVLGAAGWDVLVDAFPGRTTADQIPALRYAVGDPRRAVVIELGTNDALQVADGRIEQRAVLSSIGQALDLFGDRCVVWVVPGRDPEGKGARVGAAIADELTAQAARRPNLHLADFGAVLEEHPEYLTDDQVHLTDDGSQALAELMADSVASCR